MKKILAIFLFTSLMANAAEIFNEFYVMEKVIPLLQNSKTYTFNNEEIKAIKVDKKILKRLAITESPFYFKGKNGKLTVRVGDYLISPLTFSELHSVSSETFFNSIDK